MFIIPTTKEVAKYEVQPIDYLQETYFETFILK